MEKRGTYKRTPETLEKMRLNNLGSKNPAYGKPSSKKQKEVLSKLMQGNKYSLGKSPWNKDKFGYKTQPASEERKEKIGNANRGQKRLTATGENHWAWIKDRTQLSRISKQGERRTSAYFFWRKQVWLRDNFKCKIGNPNCKGKLEAHHILGWTDYPELRYEVNNGITLCHAHHPRKRAEEKRLSPYFMEIVSVSNK